jgi:hypothetical protein
MSSPLICLSTLTKNMSLGEPILLIALAGSFALSSVFIYPLSSYHLINEPLLLSAFDPSLFTPHLSTAYSPVCSRTRRPIPLLWSFGSTANLAHRASSSVFLMAIIAPMLVPSSIVATKKAASGLPMIARASSVVITSWRLSSTSGPVHLVSPWRKALCTSWAIRVASSEIATL